MGTNPTPNFSLPWGGPNTKSVRWPHLTHSAANAGQSVISDLDSSQVPFGHNSHILMSVASWTNPSLFFSLSCGLMLKCGRGVIMREGRKEGSKVAGGHECGPCGPCSREHFKYTSPLVSPPNVKAFDGIHFHHVHGQQKYKYKIENLRYVTRRIDGWCAVSSISPSHINAIPQVPWDSNISVGTHGALGFQK